MVGLLFMAVTKYKMDTRDVEEHSRFSAGLLIGRKCFQRASSAKCCQVECSDAPFTQIDYHEKQTCKRVQLKSMKSSRIWRQHGMSSTVWSVTNLQFFCRESHAVCAVLSRWVFNQWKRLQLIQFDHSQGTYLNPLADKIFPVQLLAIYLQTKN